MWLITYSREPERCQATTHTEPTDLHPAEFFYRLLANDPPRTTNTYPAVTRYCLLFAIEYRDEDAEDWKDGLKQYASDEKEDDDEIDAERIEDNEFDWLDDTSYEEDDFPL